MAIYTSEINQPEIRKITGVFPVICISFGDSLTMFFGKFFFINMNYFDSYTIEKLKKESHNHPFTCHRKECDGIVLITSVLTRPSVWCKIGVF